MPALLEYVRDEALPGRDEIVARLASHDREVVLRTLTLLCPCRNACYDVEVWSNTLPIWGSFGGGWDFEVREAAHHALGTVQDRARVDSRSRDLLDALAARTRLGSRAYPQWFRRQAERGATWQTAVYPKLAAHEVPTLIELLASGNARSERDALAAICPNDGHRPSKKVWQAILDARRSPSADVRAKAVRAVVLLDAHAGACERAHR